MPIGIFQDWSGSNQSGERSFIFGSVDCFDRCLALQGCGKASLEMNASPSVQPSRSRQKLYDEKPLTRQILAAMVGHRVLHARLVVRQRHANLSATRQRRGRAAAPITSAATSSCWRTSVGASTSSHRCTRSGASDSPNVGTSFKPWSSEFQFYHRTYSSAIN